MKYPLCKVLILWNLKETVGEGEKEEGLSRDDWLIDLRQQPHVVRSVIIRIHVNKSRCCWEDFDTEPLEDYCHLRSKSACSFSLFRMLLKTHELHSNLSKETQKNKQPRLSVSRVPP